MSPKCLLVLLLAVVVLTSPSLGDYMKPHPHEHMAPTPMGLPPKGEMPPTHGHHPAHPPMEHGEDLHKPPRKVMPPAPTPSEKPHGWGHGHGHGPHQPIHKLAPSPHSI
ncbi:hypothetical protein LOK49_LG06G02687 [Camellia lanceoleosa]|uniref:Uncharacterized protein n=2 Tax=Camellia lanceoleosa TaxID=1840588 RepID=A0ACC0HHE7_9ERIC|nr:hypothetical protein LOK49_LG06G02685 [Camellia lanceoleosa]KAI8012715.1 hypothetical protein LOK49_LG06G02687 [Camellia lanceoleosa]